jgi:hypothetical protein
MKCLDTSSTSAQCFDTHAFHVGEPVNSGHNPLYFASAAHMQRLNKGRDLQLFPVYVLGCASNAGPHMYLFVADKNKKEIHSYCHNNERYREEGMQCLA